MDTSSLEVFCPNRECGDPHISSGIVPVTATKYRRMNYMGKVNVGFTKKVLVGILFPNGKQPSIGMHHLYKCPVCGCEKVYVDKGGILVEL